MMHTPYVGHTAHRANAHHITGGSDRIPIGHALAFKSCANDCAKLHNKFIFMIVSFKITKCTLPVNVQGPPLFCLDLRCDYCTRLAMWLARYEVFVDQQATGWAWFQIHG